MDTAKNTKISGGDNGHSQKAPSHAHITHLQALVMYELQRAGAAARRDENLSVVTGHVTNPTERNDNRGGIGERRFAVENTRQHQRARLTGRNVLQMQWQRVLGRAAVRCCATGGGCWIQQIVVNVSSRILLLLMLLWRTRVG